MFLYFYFILCSNYRTTALILHVSKVMSRIINDRLKVFLYWQIPPEKARFIPRRGTREQIMNIRQSTEKCKEFHMPAVMCFIDYAKAFGCVKWTKLYGGLKEMAVPSHIVDLVESLYKINSMIVRTAKNLRSCARSRVCDRDAYCRRSYSTFTKSLLYVKF